MFRLLDLLGQTSDKLLWVNFKNSSLVVMSSTPWSNSSWARIILVSLLCKLDFIGLHPLAYILSYDLDAIHVFVSVLFLHFDHQSIR